MRITAVLLFAALAATLSAQQPVSEPRTISVSAEAVVRVVPDRITIRFGVETFDVLLRDAVARNEVVSAAVRKALTARGVPDRQIKTENISLDILYKSSGRPSRGIEGYYARRAWEVTLKERSQVEDVIAAVIAAGANEISSVSYGVEEVRKHRDEARRMAARAAREKAQLLAGELGATVGAPRSISETSYGGHWAYAGNAMQQNVALNAPSAGGGDDAAFAVGEVTVTATVMVTFDLK